MRSRVSIRDIAEKAGVSRTTVSNVLNRKGVEKRTSSRRAATIRRLAEEMGYVVNPAAQSLASGKTDSIIVSTCAGLTHPYAYELIEAVQLEIASHGYHMVLELFRKEEEFERAYRSFVSNRCEGVMFLGRPAWDNGWLQFMRGSGAPTVVCGHPDPDFNSAWYDLVASVRIGVEHLRAQGRTRIALVYDEPACLIRDERLRGYQEALRAAGTASDPDLLFRSKVEGADPVSLWERIRAARPTALYCYNVELAAGVLQAARKSGARVPDDIAIVTATNPLLATLVEVPLTAVDYDNRSVARALFQQLRSSIENPGARPTHVTVQPFLVVRESSGRKG